MSYGQTFNPVGHISLKFTNTRRICLSLLDAFILALQLFWLYSMHHHDLTKQIILVFATRIIKTFLSLLSWSHYLTEYINLVLLVFLEANSWFLTLLAMLCDSSPLCIPYITSSDIIDACISSLLDNSHLYLHCHLNSA